MVIQTFRTHRIDCYSGIKGNTLTQGTWIDQFKGIMMRYSQIEASVQECIFYDSILVTLLQLQRNARDKAVAAGDWIGVRLHLKRVRWCRGEEILWEVDLCWFCKPQSSC